MSEVQHTNPPMPDVPPPEGKQWSFVAGYRKGNQIVPDHWRAAVTKQKPKPKQKRGPKPDKPRFTTATHAVHLYEQLDVPIALLLGMKNGAMANMAQDYLMAAMINKALRAIDDAKVFINRFTNGVNSDDE